MKYQRFILPAMAAAALHAALLFAFPPNEVDAVIRPPAAGPSELPPMPHFPVEPPPAAVDAATQPVRPVNPGGGPPRPTLPETFRSEERELDFKPDVGRSRSEFKPGPLSPFPPGGGDGPGEWTAVPPGNLVDVGALDRPPRARAQPAPDYPAALRRDAIEGEVVVEFEVDPQGRVVTARIVGGGHREFEQAALRAVLRWRFEPGRSGGRVVPFRMTVPISFSLTRD